MSLRNLGLSLALAVGAAAAIGPAGMTASADIIITEIWQRGSGSTTPDWFEITNTGPGTVDPSTLYYDDDSADPTENARLEGITSLAPGESAVYLVSWHDDFPGGFGPPIEDFNPADALAAFNSFWGVNGAYQVGYIRDPDTGGGAGLSGGGDQVHIFSSNLDEGGANEVDAQTYTGTNTSGQTWTLNPYTGVLEHSVLGVRAAFQSVNGAQTGSPGIYVPEPTSLAMLVLGMAVVALRRRGR